MSLVSHPRRVIGAVTVLLALAVSGALASPADAAVKRTITVDVVEVEAVTSAGGQTCSGADTRNPVSFTGSRTESQTLDFVHECGSALVVEQVTVEARCPGGYRSCTMHVSVTAAIIDVNTWAWTVWGPVEGFDLHPVLSLGDLHFNSFWHSRVRFN